MKGANSEYILKYQDLLLDEIAELKLRGQLTGVSRNKLNDPVLNKLAEKEWLIPVDFNGECRYITRHGLFINTLLNLKWVTLYHGPGGVVEKVLPGEKQIIGYAIESDREWILLPSEPLSRDKIRLWLAQISLPGPLTTNIGDLAKIAERVLEFAWSSFQEGESKGEIKITPFQERILEEYVDVAKSLDKKALVIVAPTGTGKTKALQMLSLMHLLNGNIVILIYPRKSLAKQELREFLKIVYKINKEVSEDSLKQHRVEGYFIAIDDGDTPRAPKVEDWTSFRGLKCPICGSELVYVKSNNNEALVKCSNEKCDFNRYVSKYLLATKDAIERFSLNLKNINRKVSLIYITNVQCLYRRILDPVYWPLLEKASTMFLDEAHVYSYYFGGHVHYVLKEFRGVNPQIKFVLASATLANPLNFASELLGIEENKIKLVDYEKISETIEKEEATKAIRKLVIRIYALPNPEISVDTAVENFAVIIHLWCLRYDHQSIVFIDNKNTIDRLYGYIVDIVYDKRRLIEIQGLLQYKLIPEQIVPREVLEALSERRNIDNIVKRLKESIGITYSEYEQKNDVEREFLAGKIKLLLSTSTIELGINVSNVAVILQHSFPISPESFTQRVGRAGRTRETMYVSLGIMVLPHSMLGVRFVYDEHFRDEMNKFIQRVSKSSYSIMFQHLMSALILEILRKFKR